MKSLTMAVGFVSVLLAGAMFGFFYAWTVSTMWGLDAADPRISIAAMQAMNASVRNAAFAPAFFGTPFALGLAALMALAAGRRGVSLLFAIAGLAYFGGVVMVTGTVNAPMNAELGARAVPEGIDTAGAIWRDYSERWQAWNLVRTAVSGGVLLVSVAALVWCAASAGRRI